MPPTVMKVHVDVRDAQRELRSLLRLLVKLEARIDRIKRKIGPRYNHRRAET